MNELPENLPFHRLFVQLQNNGIFVGTIERLRVQKLLVDSNGAWLTVAGKEALMYEIAPLVCRNQVEQEIFYKVYENFLKTLCEPLAVSPIAPPLRFFQKYRTLLIWTLGCVILILGLINVNLYYKKSKHDILINFKEQFEGTKLIPGDTATFVNITNSQDTAGLVFVWKVKKGDHNSKLIDFIDSSSILKYIVPENKKGEDFRRVFCLEAYDRVTGDSVGIKTPLLLEINCPFPPKVSDSIKVKGKFQIGEKIYFFAPRDIKREWLIEWTFADGEKSFLQNPEHIYITTGTFNTSLEITDTTQGGRCSVYYSRQIQISNPNPTQPEALNKDEQKPNWVYTRLAKILAVTALLGSLFFFWCWWRRPNITEPLPEPQISSNLRQAFEPKDHSPYTIPYRSNNSQIYLATEQVELANTLRHRQEGQQPSLHISRTIRATIEKMGFPELCFAYNTRPTYYLFLIDLQNEDSHQAQLFHYLVEILIGQEVLADVLFYKNDFARFWNRLHPEGLSLEQLAMQYGDHRLVIFGDGDRLVSNSPNGELLHKLWADGLKRWQHRMLITPTPVVSWTYREARLYRVFAVFHADLNGLMQAAQFVDKGMDDESLPPTFAEWEKHCFRNCVDVDTDRSWRTPADHRTYFLEAQSEEPLYRWLRALVVYPELNWNVTIAIGKALGIKVCYEHLLMLARIPWLQEGVMKPSLWRAWWQELPKNEEYAARKAVRAELQAVAEKCTLGYADQKVQIRLAVQDFALASADVTTQDSIRFILSKIEPSLLLGEELDLVVARHQPSFERVAGGAGSNVLAFLRQEPKLSRPFFSKELWLGVLTLFFGLIPILIKPDKMMDYLGRKPYLGSFFVEKEWKVIPCLEQEPIRKNVLSEIRKRGEIRIVVESEAEPFNYKDENGNDAGFDYEIAKFIANELGIPRVKMLHMNPEKLGYYEFPCAFNRNIGDCFMGGYVKNMDFDHLVSWSDSYYNENGLSLIVKKGSSITSESNLKTDLRGKKIAVYNDLLAVKFVEDELGAIAKPCIDTTGNGNWIAEELEKHNMDAVIYDYPFAMSEIVRLDPSCNRYEIVQYNLYNMPYVIGIPKGNDDLLREINIAIRSLIRNEELYKSIIERNIPQPICVYSEITPKKYIIQEGESLQDVARKVYGDERKWIEIYELNKERIPNPNLVKAGDQIVIEQTRKFHIARKGETFADIAQNVLKWDRARWPELFEWNKKWLPNPHFIKPGYRIYIEPPK